jgi:hypothetical protein
MLGGKPFENLVVQKIWIDETEPFFQVKITAGNSRTYAFARPYVKPGQFLEIAEGIKTLLEEPFSILFGNIEDKTSHLDGVSLDFSADNRGHICIHIFMKNSWYHGGADTAQFLIITDIATLDEFARGMKEIINGKVGTTISLYEM